MYNRFALTVNNTTISTLMAEWYVILSKTPSWLE